ncbi:MAG TPA: dienelactone hydrolase family protein [Anaerolineales bacterium]|nr:dienelactone hydrolase family protein [Anaerolineales bacterium]HLO28632.1 dienelactone hydrolase family protein [Anaerolineales bacterium]
MEAMTFRDLTDQVALLYTKDKYAEALQLVEQNADRFPEQSVRTTFWQMCLLSLCNRPDDVMFIFRQALAKGFWWAESQFQDTDLDAVRDLPEFKGLMAISQKKYEEARKHIEPDQAILLPEASASHLYPLLIALHGGAGNKDANLEYWEIARRKGWLVLSPQSTQPLYSGAYAWLDGEQGLTDLIFSIEKVSRECPIDPQRVVVAGFSQGAGMAIYAALSGRISIRGFLGIAAFWANPGSLVPRARAARSVRGYFITGEKDRTLDKIREIQKTLQENNIQFAEEVYPDLGHEFPPDFEKSFDKAIDFIFTEQE